MKNATPCGLPRRAFGNRDARPVRAGPFPLRPTFLRAPHLPAGKSLPDKPSTADSLTSGVVPPNQRAGPNIGQLHDALNIKTFNAVIISAIGENR